MSWLAGLASGEEPAPYKDTSTDKVPDPSIPARMVSNKAANQPFLAYKEYRANREALHAAWLEKKKERDEKIARGEKVGPLERDPTGEQEIGILGLLKVIVVVLICVALAGKFVTGSYTWEYKGKWLQLKTYWPQNQRLFSGEYLAQFNGQDGRPSYLAIDGDIYDVSKGRSYQPGGTYHHLIGRDATRAFGTSCSHTLTHLTHDIRGLTEEELNALAHWKTFFVEHQVYVKVGRVSHPPIDPESPIPVHCDPKKARAAEEAEAARKGKKSERDEL